MAILNNSNAISSGGYDINNSLRFRQSASAYLLRTPASASNQKTWTWSAWVKRGLISSTQTIFYISNGLGLYFQNAYYVAFYISHAYFLISLLYSFHTVLYYKNSF